MSTLLAGDWRFRVPLTAHPRRRLRDAPCGPGSARRHGSGRGIQDCHYCSDPGRCAVDGEQAAVGGRISPDFAAGASIMGITSALNEDVVPTWTCGARSAWTIRKLLRNPAYAGHTIVTRTQAS